MKVIKLRAGLYGRTNVPAQGSVVKTREGNLRITPQGKGIPAQCFVKWIEGEHTWERLRDLELVRSRETRPPKGQLTERDQIGRV